MTERYIRTCFGFFGLRDLALSRIKSHKSQRSNHDKHEQAKCDQAIGSYTDDYLAGRNVASCDDTTSACMTAVYSSTTFTGFGCIPKVAANDLGCLLFKGVDSRIQVTNLLSRAVFIYAVLYSCRSRVFCRRNTETVPTPQNTRLNGRARLPSQSVHHIRAAHFWKFW
jgi:hypothetical protein